MSLNIAVCIKPVPDPDHYDKIRIDPDTKALIRAGIPSVINTADKNAIELAVSLKEKYGGEITVATMAPPSAREQLLEALSYGIDKAYLLSDRRLGGADTLATSYSLCHMLNKIGKFDLVILGNESDDGATAHVPSQLGEWMGAAHMSDVTSVDVLGNTLLLTKEYEDCFIDYEAELPCVIGVRKNINEVRYPTTWDILTAKDKPYTIFSKDDLPEIDDSLIGLAGSPTRAGDLHTPEYSREAVEITGNAEEIADQILKILETK